MSTSDEQLIQKFCGGNTGAFNRLVERWQTRIHRVAYRYFNSHDEAADITQKTFIKVYKKLHTLDDQAAFTAWIYRIAHTTCAGMNTNAPGGGIRRRWKYSKVIRWL